MQFSYRYSVVHVIDSFNILTAQVRTKYNFEHTLHTHMVLK